MAVFTNNVYLENDYGLDYTLGVSTLGDVYATVDDAAVDFPWWCGYCTCDSTRCGLGVPDRVPTPGAPVWSDGDILNCSYAVAAHNDAVWATGGAIGNNWYFGALPLSRCNIIWPHGSYYINYPLMVNFGQYIGQGSAQYAPDLNSPLSEVCFGTRLSLWHEEWLDVAGYDNGPVKQIWQTINWPCAVGGTLYAGVLGASGGSADALLNAYYMEGAIIKGFRMDGRKSAAPEAVDGGDTYVTTYEDAGIAAWRFGSVSGVEECIADSFNNAGYCLASGTPGFLKNNRSFDCNYASLWLRGDGNFHVFGFEVDESPTAVKATAFVDPTNPSNNLLTPGCTLDMTGVKIETGTSGVSSRYKGTMLFDGEGWCRVTIDGVSYASSNIYPELLCRIDPYPTGFTATNSYLKLSGLKTFGFFRTLMHHAPTTGQAKKWFMDKGEYTQKYNASCGDFVYNSANGGTCETSSGENITQILVPYTNRQDWLPLPRVTDWDDTVDPGTPAYTNPAS